MCAQHRPPSELKKEEATEQAESDTWISTIRAVPSKDGDLLQGSPVGENANINGMRAANF